MRADAYQLRNLSFPRKLLESAGLLLFTAIYVLTWWKSVRSVHEGYTVEAIFYYWGNVLTDIRNEDMRTFLLLCAGNLGSMSALLLMSNRLFRRTALRHRVRFAWSLLAGLRTALKVLLWATRRVGWMRCAVSVSTKRDSGQVQT